MKALRCHAMQAAICVVPLIVGLFAGAGIVAAQEPTRDQQSAIRSNCRTDFMANCSGVPRGGKEALQCLKSNVAKLSPDCQQAVKAVMPAPPPKPPAPPVTATPAAPAAPPPASAVAAPVAATPPVPAAPAATPAVSTATQAAPTPTAAKPAAAPAASTPQAAAAKPASVKPSAPAAPAAKSAAKPPASAPVPAAAPPAVIVVAPIQVFALVRTKCRAEYRAYCSDVDIGGGRVVACLQSNAASLSPICQGGLAELGR
jgi:hypothetical protein